MLVGPAVGDRETLSVDTAEFAKPAAKLVTERILSRRVVENADLRYPLPVSGVLRTCRLWSSTMFPSTPAG